ncbi:MAG TPA: M50 family metallopeptidase [Chthonomonadaceae bacterium]|nr:M50 family metallopeptidase [Chthonomonadaceae bacterium]
MEIIRTALYFIAVLSVLIIVHEWGHFIVAKLCKMRVEDFSLFFGKRLIRLGVRNGTEYNIRSIPLGGFVKIAGMEPDDISNGAPIFPHHAKIHIDVKEKAWRNDPRRLNINKTLRGLDEEALETLDTVNFDQVSERVFNAVAEAVGDDGRLTDEGREELKSLLTSTGINDDEYRYLTTILSAQALVQDPNGYNAKPLWQRALTIFAGPFMSIFFGFLIFCVMGFTTGIPDLNNPDNTIGAVIKGKAADKAGLQPGDKIVVINGVKINDWNSMVDLIHNNPGRPIRLVILRDHKPMNVTATPDADTVQENGKKVTEGRLGFYPGGMAWRRYTPVAAITHGSDMLYAEVAGTLKTVFSKHVREGVGGIITIGRIINQDSKEGPQNVLFTAGMLSISVGLINLFPIPILDGGHLLLLAIEGIRRRKLSSREVYAAQMIGISIIGVLFVLVMYNDISHLFTP